MYIIFSSLKCIGTTSAKIKYSRSSIYVRPLIDHFQKCQIFQARNLRLQSVNKLIYSPIVRATLQKRRKLLQRTAYKSESLSLLPVPLCNASRSLTRFEGEE